MKFIEKHDKDLAANFDKETSRQTRARSNAKQSVSGKRNAPLTIPKEKEPPKRKRSTSKNVYGSPSLRHNLILKMVISAPLL